MSAADPLITIAEAQRRVAAACIPLGVEPVPVAQALGRTLGKSVRALGDVPPFVSSAMDGYAVVHGPAGRVLEIIGESRAGAPCDQTVDRATAVRISTGAELPAGADAVVPLETAVAAWGAGGESVSLPEASRAGQNVRARGEDMRAGETVLEAGTPLEAAELGVAVAAGHGELSCGRRPRVGIVAGGDELVAPGTPLGPGQIHDSNAVTLVALASRAGAEIVSVGGMADTPQATRQALAEALERCDVLVISGGVSVGAHDHVKDALASLAVEQRFWRVALKPGKPTWFGVRDSRLVFGLPGNPVSAMVTFLLFARPALAALQAARLPVRRRRATLAATLSRNERRDEAIRVSLAEHDGRLEARPTGRQGSHLLTSMLGADGLVVVEAGSGELAAGTPVDVELI